jgi:pentatricopeptide repeat protein
MLQEMQATGVAPDVITYSILISACAKGGKWERALALLEEMRAAGVKPDVYSFSAAIQACAAAQQPAVARQLFEEASSTLTADRVTFNAVLDAVCTHDPAEARALWRRGCELGLYTKVEQTERGEPMLDLHDHSEGAAETAVRWWLEERVLAMRSAPEQLIIVTGWGKTRSAVRDSDIRGRVVRVLSELDATTLPTDNPGRIVVDARVWLAQG